jgi:glutaryl-CoA dehydrogenase
MARFPGVDYLRIDSLFSEQELLVAKLPGGLWMSKSLPLIRDCFRDARFPKELIPEMARLGSWAQTWKATAAPA